jgi:hypothetical protein
MRSTASLGPVNPPNFPATKAAVAVNANRQACASQRSNKGKRGSNLVARTRGLMAAMFREGMRCAAGTLVIAVCLLVQAQAQDTAPLTPVNPQDIQDPDCEFGVGPCGGTCNEEGGKHWNCLAMQLPCYKGGGRCACEAASQCKVFIPQLVRPYRRRRRFRGVRRYW